MKKILIALAFAASASMAMAGFVPVTNFTYDTVYFIKTITTGGGNVVSNAFLANGTSTGGPSAGTIGLMDNKNLDDITVGNGTQIDTVLFGGTNYTDINGSSLPDFFLFEAGATPDPVSITPIFTNGTFGTAVALPGFGVAGWGDTGLDKVSAPQGGQSITGIGWDITDMKDAGGANLTSTAVIRGIRITPAGSIDPCAFLAYVPPYPIDHYSVTPSVGSASVGDAFDVTITAQDAGNNTVTNIVTVTVTAAGSLMEFDWNSDGTYGDNSGTLVAGVKTIKARNKRAETANIVAVSGPAATTTPPAVTTTALAFSQLQVLAPGETAAPGTATGKIGLVPSQSAGTPFTVTVNAVDTYWNFISTAPADIIAVTSTDGTATLPLDAALDLGTTNFSITFNQLGTFTITASNTTAVVANGVSSPIVSGAALVWKGDGVANLWNTSALNWTNGIAMTSYTSGDFVTFDNTGSTTPAVDIVGTVTPGTVTFDTANNYTLSSTSGGGIGGAASIIKNGAGTLTLNTSNSYSGSTFISGGSLILSNANALPGINNNFTMSNGVVVMAAGNITTGSGTLAGNTAEFRAIGANRSVALGNMAQGNDLFAGATNEFGEGTETILVLGRASDGFTVDFQSQMDFLFAGGDKVILVEDGAAAVDAVISGRLLDNSGNTGALVKKGAGTLLLTSATSNYEIPTRIENGTVILTGSLDSDTDIILGSGTTNGVFQLGNSSGIKDHTAEDISISGTGTGNRIVGGNSSVSTLTINTVNGDVLFDGILGGPGANQDKLALTKNGVGLTLTLTAANTFTGGTRIQNGILALSGAGSINSSPTIDVENSGSTFDVSAVTGGYVLGATQRLLGFGSVNGDVKANGLVTPGGNGLGTFTFTGSLTINPGGTNRMRIDTTPTANDQIAIASGAYTNLGTLQIVNNGVTAELTNGISFQLFSTAVSGSINSIVYPAVPAGLQWTNKLAVDGTIAVVTAPPPPLASITNTVSGNTLTLNWPAGQGWKLQAQTNTPANLTTTWGLVSGAVPPFVIPINPTNGSVYYRLVWP